MLGWAIQGQLRTWVVAELVIWATGIPTSGKGREPAPYSHAIRVGFPLPVVRVGPSLQRAGVSSPMRASPSLLLQCPVRDRASLPWASKGWGWFRTTL